jgi:hypothetical protein
MMADRTKTMRQTKVVAKAYKPTPYERKLMETYLARRKERPPAPRMKVSRQDGVTKLASDHPEPSVAHVRLLEALGSRDLDFLDGLLKQLCIVGSHGRSVDEDGLNFMLSLVKGIEPRDQVEAMLAAQMAATHNAIMTVAGRLNHAQNIPQRDSAERAFNKLARTFTSQMETLKRYRSEGQQKILVQHTTTVNADQALITDRVVTGKNNAAAPTAKHLTAATNKPMKIIEPMRKEAVPVGGGGAKAK